MKKERWNEIRNEFLARLDSISVIDIEIRTVDCGNGPNSDWQILIGIKSASEYSPIDTEKLKQLIQLTDDYNLKGKIDDDEYSMW